MSKSIVTKERELELLKRRQEVVNLYLKGLTQWEIALRLGLSNSTVSNDISAIRKLWIDSSLRDFNEIKANELAKIDKLESIAWDAWENSCKDREEKSLDIIKGRSTKMGRNLPNLTKESRKSINQTGNAKFLERVAWCIQTRLKIFGILDSDKVNVNNVVQIDWNNLKEREIIESASVDKDLAKALEELANSKYTQEVKDVTVPLSTSLEMSKSVEE